MSIKISGLALFFITAQTASISAEDRWVWQNPLPQGNSLHAIAFPDAQNGYIVGESGALLKTQDRGASWSFLTIDAAEDLFSVDFLDASMGFTVGTRGALYKTEDSGMTWSKRETGNNQGLYSVLFTDSDTGYAAGDSGVIIKTTDGGNSWNQVHKRENTKVTAMHFFTALTGLAVGTSGFVFRTADGGKTWASSNLGPVSFSAIQFLDPDTGYLLGTTGVGTARYLWHGDVYKTTNGGTDWNKVSVPELRGRMTSLCFLDANTGYVSTDSGEVYKSSDGGVNWSVAFAGSAWLPLKTLASAGRGTVFAAGADGILLKSVEGSNWSEVSIGTSAFALQKVHFPDSETGYSLGQGPASLSGDLANSLMKTSNGGRSWSIRPWMADSGKELMLNSIFFTDSVTGFVVGEERAANMVRRGKILHTGDGGTSWSTQDFDAIDQFNAVHFADRNLGMAVGRSAILLTRDGGTSWSQLPGFRQQAWLCAQWVDTKVGYIGGVNLAPGNNWGVILKTSDGGMTWDTSEIDRDNRRFIKSLSFPEPNIGYALQDTALYKSTDGGKTWTISFSLKYKYDLASIQFLDERLGYAVGSKPASIGIEGMRGVVLKTTDGGRNWNPEPLLAKSAFYGLHFPNQSIGFVVGAGGVILNVQRDPQSGIMVRNSEVSGLQSGGNGEFRYRLISPGRVTATLRDLNGKLVKEILDENRVAGEHTFTLPMEKRRGAYILVFQSQEFKRALRVLRN